MRFSALAFGCGVLLATAAGLAPLKAQDLKIAMLEVSIDNAQLVISDQLKAIYAAKAEIHSEYRFNRDRTVHNIRQIGFIRRCTLFVRRGRTIFPEAGSTLSPTSEYDLAGEYRFEVEGAQVKLLSPTKFRTYSNTLQFPNEAEAIRFSAAMNPLARDCRELARLK